MEYKAEDITMEIFQAHKDVGSLITLQLRKENI